jgi:hypothetical protein
MALRDQPYLPLYVLDFLVDEKLAYCSAESTGVYIRLMCILHKMPEYGVVTLKEREKKSDDTIRNFADQLSYLMPYQIDVIDRSLRELVSEGVLTLEGERLYQKRMVKDGEISAKRSDAGKRGADSTNSRFAAANLSANGPANTSANSQANVSANHPANSENEIENESEIESEIDIEDDRVSVSVPKKNLQEERFDEFWKAYPRKSNKGGARKAWKKLSPDKELFAKIMAALEIAKKCEQWTKDRGQFIPYPATWLNQERWDDDYGSSLVTPGAAQDDFDPDNPYADWGPKDDE